MISSSLSCTLTCTGLSRARASDVHGPLTCTGLRRARAPGGRRRPEAAGGGPLLTPTAFSCLPLLWLKDKRRSPSVGASGSRSRATAGGGAGGSRATAGGGPGEEEEELGGAETLKLQHKDQRKHLVPCFSTLGHDCNCLICSVNTDMNE